jgi:hypothetical protein
MNNAKQIYFPDESLVKEIEHTRVLLSSRFGEKVSFSEAARFLIKKGLEAKNENPLV